MTAVTHFSDILKLAAGGSVAAVVGYFGAGEINTARDLEGLKHDVSHHEQIINSFASDFSEMRKSLQDIDRHLATVTGQEGMLQADLADVKRAIQETLRDEAAPRGRGQ